MTVVMMVKTWFIFCLSFLVTLSECFVPEYEATLNKIHSERASASTQEQAAQNVLARLLPNHLSSFEFRIIMKAEVRYDAPILEQLASALQEDYIECRPNFSPISQCEKCGGKSCFQIQNHPSAGLFEGAPEIRISGTTAVELCAGLHWYLKHWCDVHISWDKTGGAQLRTIPRPGFLPRVQHDTLTIQRPVEWNYYQNVVTSSYSYVWWTWERWEKEIDWMALQGINLPLAFTGQETIWQKVFQSEAFNLTKAELDDYFGGPAFLAWARMGNLKRWEGPLPQTWLDQQLQLQKKILARMRELGMTPVLPAFGGNIPAAITKKFPSAKVTRLGDWNTVDGDKRYCCTFLLDPKDPLFVDIGEAFILQQIKEYGGTHHIYNCDTFNENEPPTDDPSYISDLGAIVYKGMNVADEDAIWLMQGWLFAKDETFWKPPLMKALLHSVPVGRLVVLDLFADVKPIWLRSDHFYGIPYIWCMLHNFGGNVEMYGRLDVLGSEPVEAAASPNSTMVGVGMCMEGIEQNPVVYDLMAEMAFHNATLNVEDWVEKYPRRRYGEATAGAGIAWKMLHQSIYNCSDGIADHNGDVIVEFPDYNPKQLKKPVRGRNLFSKHSLSHPQHMWYSPQDAAVALQYLLASADALASSKPYRYDVVDLTRQVLSKLANQLYSEVLAEYERFSVENVENASQKLVELLADMDDLLGASDEFLLGPWLEIAKALATTDDEKKLYEWNARTQITMWFDNTPDKPSPLHDYANKMWSGVIRDYYLPRAAIYLKYLKQSLDCNTSFAFQEWRRDWIALTNNFQYASNLYPTAATGDSLQIATTLYEKYAGLIVDTGTSAIGLLASRVPYHGISPS